MKTKTLIMAAFAMVAAASCCQQKDTSVHQSMYDLNMPIIQTKYTADPAPIVIGDTLYLTTYTLNSAKNTITKVDSIAIKKDANISFRPSLCIYITIYIFIV